MLFMSLNYRIIIGSSEDMSRIEDGIAQLTVTSPPYHDLVVFSEGDEKGSENDLSRIKSQDEFFERISKVWKECYRITKYGGYLACEFEDIPTGGRTYGYPREICLVGPMIESIESAGFHLISRWFWRKFSTGAVLSKFQYTLHSHLTSSDPRAIANVAYILVFKKGRGGRPEKLDFTKKEWTLWCDGLWRIENPSGGDEGLASGAIFPDELVRRLIKIYSSPYDTVLDPFLGTGTTMKVAFEQDRSCIGYEALARMLPFIKKKVGYRNTKLFSKVEWSVYETY